MVGEGAVEEVLCEDVLNGEIERGEGADLEGNEGCLETRGEKLLTWILFIRWWFIFMMTMTMGFNDGVFTKARLLLT